MCPTIWYWWIVRLFFYSIHHLNWSWITFNNKILYRVYHPKPLSEPRSLHPTCKSLMAIHLRLGILVLFYKHLAISICLLYLHILLYCHFFSFKFFFNLKFLNFFFKYIIDTCWEPTNFWLSKHQFN